MKDVDDILGRMKERRKGNSVIRVHEEFVRANCPTSRMLHEMADHGHVEAERMANEDVGEKR